MSEIYRIAVRLTMQSNAPQFFAALSRTVLHTHAQVRDLEGGLNRVKLALAGGLGIAAGTGLLAGLATLAEKAKDLSSALATIRTFKIDPAAGAALAAQADAVARATTRAVAGSTEAGNVRIFGESYSMFGADGAAKVNAPLARYSQVLGGITGDYEGAQEKTYAMIRAGELMGKLVNEKTHQVDPDRLFRFLDLVAQVGAATHGKVGPDTFMQLAQQGGPALATMSDEGILTMAMAAQGMGGFRAGTALSSLYQQAVGGKMTAQVAGELHRLGLVGDFKTIRGGGVQFEKGALDTDWTRALRKDPALAEQIMMRAMSGHGIDGLDNQTGELFKILGRQTTQRLISDLLRNLPQFLAERARIEGAQGIEGQDATRERYDLGRNMHDFGNAYENLAQALAGPNSQAAIGVMKTLTGAMNSLTETVRGMKPETLQAIANGLGILGVSLVAAGGAALIAAMGPAGWLVLGIGALAGAFKAFAPEQFDKWLEGLKKLVHGLATLNWSEAVNGIAMEFGAAFALLPGKVQTAITAAIDGIANLIKSAFAALWDTLKNGFDFGGGGGRNQGYRHKTLFDGDSGGSLYNASWEGGNLYGSHASSAVSRAANAASYAGGGYGGLPASEVIRRYGGGGGGFNTRGVRNFNPGNVAYGGWARAHGATGAAGTDTGHGVAVFPSFEVGYAAMGALALSKYSGGRRSIDSLIAGANGWTPGNHAAAANVARMMGISPFADAHLDDPSMMAKFKAALSVQELGPAGARYAFEHMRKTPGAPPHDSKPVEVHTHTHLDGKVIAKVVTRHQTRMATMPHAVGGHDSYGSYFGPGHTEMPS